TVEGRQHGIPVPSELAPDPLQLRQLSTDAIAAFEEEGDLHRVSEFRIPPEADQFRVAATSHGEAVSFLSNQDRSAADTWAGKLRWILHARAGVAGTFPLGKVW